MTGNLMSYAGMAPMTDGAAAPSTDEIQHRSLHDRHLREKGTSGSFTAELLSIPDYVLHVRAYAGAGAMTKAKEAYDKLTAFHQANAEKISQALTIDPKGDPLLVEVQKGATALFDRAFDKVVVDTPYGKMAMSELFGPKGMYQKAKESEYRVQNFSQQVIDAATSDDQPLVEVLAPLVNDPTVTAKSFPYLAGRTPYGATKISLSQRQDLADTIVRRWGQDSKKLDTDALRRVATYVMTTHMDNGAASILYGSLVDMISSRADVLGSAEGLDVKYADDLIRSFDSLTRRSSAPANGGDPAPEASRLLAVSIAKTISVNRNLDLTDVGTQEALGSVMDAFASAQRSGVDLLPLMTQAGIEFGPAIASYVTAAKQGLPVPQENMLNRIFAASHRLDYILSDQWPAAAKPPKRGDPRDQAGAASGAFGHDSGSIGLNSASVAVKSVLLPEVIREFGRGTKTELAALGNVLNSAEVRGKLAGRLSESMMIPLGAAQLVADRFADNLMDDGGVRSSWNLEQAISDAVNDKTGSIDWTPEEKSYRAILNEWYTMNLGPGSKAVKDALRGWYGLLLDDTLGFGATPAGRAQADNMYQSVIQSVHEAMKEGVSLPEAVSMFTSTGKYYAVTGYIDQKGERHTIKDPSDVPKGVTPIIEIRYGNWNAASQEVKGLTMYGGESIPVYEKGLSSRKWEEFMNAQRQLKRAYDFQQKMAAQMATRAIKAASTPKDEY